MHTSSTLWALLLLACSATASPPTTSWDEPLSNATTPAFCCCDPGRNVISCNTAIKKEDCVCLAVACPRNAPTVWVRDPLPTATAIASITSISRHARPTSMTTKRRKNHKSREEGGFPSSMLRAPSVRAVDARHAIVVRVEASRPQGTAAPTGMVLQKQQQQQQQQQQQKRNESGGMAPCCCCDVRYSRYSCQMKAREECFCAKVVCPAEATTVWRRPEATGRNEDD